MPSMRATATIPLAAPVRSAGAAVSRPRLLGAWNRPIPAPHSSMRQTMSTLVAWAGRNASSTTPQHRTAAPAPVIAPPGSRSARRPDTGPAKTTINGQGVISSPVAEAERPRPCSNRKGRATKLAAWQA